MKKLIYSLLFAVLCVGFTACNDDDNIPLPDITVNFASGLVGLDTEDESENVTISLSRAAQSNIDLLVTMTPNGVTYGNQFTTTPAAVSNAISLTIPAGSTSSSITVTKEGGVLLDGDESISFSVALASSISGVKLGTTTASSLTFGSILSLGDELTLEGKTSEENYFNTVYVDFSSNKTTLAARKSWALGFYCGDEFTVTLNGAYGMAATKSTKTNIDDIVLADAEGAIDIGAATMVAEGYLVAAAIDNVDGSLTGTVFGEISATSSENYVFFVATEDDKASKGNWYKIKVDRNGDGYTVKYGKVDNSISVQTVNIPKDSKYNFKFLSLSTGNLVSAEPQAAKWDIMWSYNTALTNMMGSMRPYFMQDLLLINNLAGVETAQVMTSTVSYDDYSASNIATTTFSGARNTIGANWRTMGAGMPPVGAQVYSDRFYVIKDPAGNYYKMKVTKAGIGDSGERGRPEIEYTLVQ